jgi:hypothetical protein
MSIRHSTTDLQHRRLSGETLSVQELREAIAIGEIIEDYPTDKYGPSCLVFGVTLARRPLHIQCR